MNFSFILTAFLILSSGFSFAEREVLESKRQEERRKIQKQIEEIPVLSIKNCSIKKKFKFFI